MTTLARSAAGQRVGGRVIAAFAAVYVIWGSTYLFIKLAIDSVPPLLMSGARFLIAGGILLAITARMRGASDDPVGLAGTGVLLRPGAAGGGDLGHMLLVLGSPLAWSIGSLYATRGPLPRRLFVATGMEMLCGGALLAVGGLITGEASAVHLDRITTASWLSFLYLIVFGSLVAFSAYVWLLSKVPTTAVATYAYVNPLVAVLLGWLVLGERITGQTLIAAALIIVAVVLILSRPPAAPARPPRRVRADPT
jgi:drug/metabolite transporter (DMT)-like permease